MKKLKGIAKVQTAKLRRCYVYEIRVDGVIRYIGKGCNDRINSHLIEARRTASRSEVKIRNLSSPRSSRQGASSAIDEDRQTAERRDDLAQKFESVNAAAMMHRPAEAKIHQ